MVIFTKDEKNILTKFIGGCKVSSEDVKILERYANVGLVQYGFDWDSMSETAKLTESGFDHLMKYKN